MVGAPSVCNPHLSRNKAKHMNKCEGSVDELVGKPIQKWASKVSLITTDMWRLH